MILKRAILSKFRKGFKYAEAGEEVKIVGTLLVENKFGVKFSIDSDDILLPGESIINEEIYVNKIPAKPKNVKSPGPENKKTLF